MKLSSIQRYELTYFLNYLIAIDQHHQIVEIIKDILDESQTRDDFKKSIFALMILRSTEGGSSQAFSYFIIEHFCGPSSYGFRFDIFNVIYREIEREQRIGESLGCRIAYKDLLDQLKEQKFLPALDAWDGARLGYAPSHLRYAMEVRTADMELSKISKRKSFIKGFEQGISDDESLFCYANSLVNFSNRYHDRMCYIWEKLVERDAGFGTRSRHDLCQYSQYSYDTIIAPKLFQQLLQEATTPTIIINGLSTTHLTGDPRSQALVGFCYHIGLGVELNIAKAIHFYKLSGDKDVFWDLYSCFKIELRNGNINIGDVIEFYQKHLSVSSTGDLTPSIALRINQCKVLAYLILADMYDEGIEGFVNPNRFKAYEYYSEALKITSTKPLHWDEENKIAQNGKNNIQSLIIRRNQILNSLAPVGISISLCNLIAEYTSGYTEPETSDLAKSISKINAEFLCIEKKRNAEVNAVEKMQTIANPLVISSLESVNEMNPSNPSGVGFQSDGSRRSVLSKVNVHGNK